MRTGERIRQARKELGMTQQDLSQLTGIDRPLIAHYELGKVQVPLSKLPILAEHLRKDISWFVEESPADPKGMSSVAKALDEVVKPPVNAFTHRQVECLREFFQEFKRAGGERRTVDHENVVRMTPQEREVALTALAEPAKIHRLPELKVEHKAAAGPGEFVDVPEEYLLLGQHRWQKGYRPFRVTGDSMAPFIMMGDYVVVDVDRDPVDGDVVLARVHEGLAVKRFYRQKDHVELVSINPEYSPMRLREVALLGVLVDIVRPVMKIFDR